MQKRLLFETIVFFVTPKMPTVTIFLESSYLHIGETISDAEKSNLKAQGSKSIPPSKHQVNYGFRFKQRVVDEMGQCKSDLALKTLDFPGTLTVSDCSYQLSTLSMVVKSKNMSFLNFNGFSFLNLNDFSTCSLFLWHVIFPNKDLNKREIHTR